MDEVKAFVGHSFTNDDTDLVKTFLTYFDQIHSIYSPFSWEHAEGAEPRQLSEKVLSLMDGKNLFIGICTKKEYVARPASLKDMFFHPDHKRVQNSDLQWKTSDWIIQEIGLAFGRGLDLILLMEEGLRQPGGLQGNVEYITFSRSSPEKSFGKILEMIQSLTPKPAQGGSATAEAVADDKPAESKVKDKAKDWANPQPDWTPEDYSNAAFHLVFDGRLDDVKKITEKYIVTKEGSPADSQAEFNANIEFWRIIFGKDGSIDRLKKICDDNRTNSKILSYFGSALNNHDRHLEAAGAFKEAALAADDDTDKYNLLGRSASSLAEGGDAGGALALLDDLRGAASTNPQIQPNVLEALRKVMDVLKNDSMALAVMERIVAIAPGDIDTRFSLAYKHSEMGNNDMALYHYLKIPFNERRAIAWNNLGVAFNEFGMPSKAVNSYRRASDRGETLAMSNLGYKFLQVGFIAEAKNEFDKALGNKDYHKNVNLGLARIKDIPEEEDKKEQDILLGVKQKAEFYEQLGIAASQPTLKTVGSRWRGTECELDISVSGNKVRAIGSYEKEVGGGLMMAFPSSSKATAKFQIEYEGTLNGRVVDGTVKRIRQEGAPPTALGMGDTSIKVLMSFSEDNTIKVIENPHSGNPSYYEMKVL